MEYAYKIAAGCFHPLDVCQCPLHILQRPSHLQLVYDRRHRCLSAGQHVFFAVHIRRYSAETDDSDKVWRVLQRPGHHPQIITVPVNLVLLYQDPLCGRFGYVSLRSIRALKHLSFAGLVCPNRIHVRSEAEHKARPGEPQLSCAFAAADTQPELHRCQSELR